MRCDRCSTEAVRFAPYSGAHLCADHFCRSVEKRVRHRVREDNLIPTDASPEAPVTWVIGLSGGKDSAVLTHILHETFERDPRIDLFALTIHEGIEGYRDESLEACKRLAGERDIRHEIASYDEEFSIAMDDVVEQDRSMAACAYCGVFRRDVLERRASDLGADLLLTGHNLDDEAQTALMNFLSGDLTQIAKHHEASLGGLHERATNSPFTPRAKPLRDVPEKEVALYARLRELPAHITECPHASGAYRGEIQELLLALEDNHPGTRHSIMSGYEELAARLAAEKTPTTQDELTECDSCEALTVHDVCRSCQLLTELQMSG